MLFLDSKLAEDLNVLPRSIKTKKVIAALIKAGGVATTGAGDHVVIHFPKGESISLPKGGVHSDVSPGILCKARKLLKQYA